MPLRPPRPAAARAHLRRPRGAGERRARRRRLRGRPRRSSRASPTVATQARATRCGSRRLPGAIDDDWVAARDRGLPRWPTSASTASGSTPRSTSSTSASPASASCRRSTGRRSSARAGQPAPKFEREVVFEIDGQRRSPSPTPFYDRSELRGGPVDHRAGDHRAVRLDDGDPAGLAAEIDRYGNIVVDCTRAKDVAEAGAALATPVLMRVIGGAFQSIAKEMGSDPLPHLLLVDHPGVRGPRRRPLRREGNELAESDSTPMFMGAMPKIVKGVIRELGRRDPRRRRHRAQPPLQGRDTHPGHRHRRADLLGRRAGRLLGRVRTPARHRRRLSGDGDRPRRHVGRGPHPRCGQALRARRPQRVSSGR